MGGNLELAEKSSGFWTRYFRRPVAGLNLTVSPFSFPARRLLFVPSHPAPGRPPGRTTAWNASLPSAITWTPSLSPAYSPWTLTSTGRLGSAGSVQRPLVSLGSAATAGPASPAMARREKRRADRMGCSVVRGERLPAVYAAGLSPPSAGTVSLIPQGRMADTLEGDSPRRGRRGSCRRLRCPYHRIGPPRAHFGGPCSNRSRSTWPSHGNCSPSSRTATGTPRRPSGCEPGWTARGRG